MAAKTTSTSKLGGVYQLSEIQASDKLYHRELSQLRRLPGNTTCADCSAPDTNWASCNLGVFLCVNCAQIHRGVGTHVTKVKSCMGTYLWHPDEMDMMRNMGNQKANAHYLAKNPNPGKLAGGALRQHIVDKYERQVWVA